MNYLERYFKKRDKDKSKNLSAGTKDKKDKSLEKSNIQKNNDKNNNIKIDWNNAIIDNDKEKDKKFTQKKKQNTKKSIKEGSINKEDKIFKRKVNIKYKNLNMYNYIISKENIPFN